MARPIVYLYLPVNAKICCFIIGIICFPGFLFSQAKLSRLSRPEKIWVLKHPFIAKKSWRVTQQVLAITDSLRRNHILSDDNGGRLDAFRHSCWMALLTKKIGERRALQLGEAHEKGNYLDFKKHRLENGAVPDSVSGVMDRLNNRIGAELAVEGVGIDSNGIIAWLIERAKSDQLITIRKDAQGNFLDANGAIIDMEKWKDQWGTPKILSGKQ